MKPLSASTTSVASRWRPLGWSRRRTGLRPLSAAVSKPEVKNCGQAGLSRRLHPWAWVTLLLALAPSFAIDLSSWGRQVHSYEDWTIVEFRDPLMGKYLFSRAGTEDHERSATLTLTASPIDACAAETVIVIQLGTANTRDVSASGEIEIAIDDLVRVIVPVSIIMPRGDQFAFLKFPENYDAASLAHRKAMNVTLQGNLLARFSLKGFGSSWAEAQSTCQGFAPH